ncbi:unnamed protein product [Meganyctiphanes norvegica]|uniref:Cation/H+ exchanger transmembrane domain-containing protein n=1 Tax=Meganyctiphanes norvegica TaxID=48144 RepID=A0AAV2PMK5_MEGNR
MNGKPEEEQGTSGGCLGPLLQSNHPLGPNPTFMEKIANSLYLPPHGALGKCLTWGLISLLFWFTIYSILGADGVIGGNIFSLFLIFILCHLGGEIVSTVKLPPLLGMLIVGICLKSIPALKPIGDGYDADWARILKKLALIVILIRAGLGLDPVKLRELKFTVLKMALVPVALECTTYGVLGHLLLGMPFLWSFMMGFVLSAVSPAVVVPAILHISGRGFGLNKGIPTLIMAAASVDNVINISGFGIMLGITFSKGTLVGQIFQGPSDVLIGLAYGIGLGLICLYLPNRKEGGASITRFILLLVGGCVATFGSAKVEHGGAGPLATVVMAFTAGVGWRKQGMTEANNPVKAHFGTMWTFFQTFLFGLMGASINITTLNPDTVKYGIICIAVGTLIRGIFAFIATYGSGFNLKEQIYVAMGRFPKATIQAAIGSYALDYARTHNGTEEEIAWGQQILTISILIILITAPVGSAFLMLSAPKMLHKTVKEEEEPKENGAA